MTSNDELREGPKKGGVNSLPTNKRPEPPKAQWNAITPEKQQARISELCREGLMDDSEYTTAWYLAEILKLVDRPAFNDYKSWGINMGHKKGDAPL